MSYDLKAFHCQTWALRFFHSFSEEETTGEESKKVKGSRENLDIKCLKEKEELKSR